MSPNTNTSENKLATVALLQQELNTLSNGVNNLLTKVDELKKDKARYEYLKTRIEVVNQTFDAKSAPNTWLVMNIYFPTDADGITDIDTLVDRKLTSATQFSQPTQ